MPSAATPATGRIAFETGLPESLAALVPSLSEEKCVVFMRAGILMQFNTSVNVIVDEVVDLQVGTGDSTIMRGDVLAQLAITRTLKEFADRRLLKIAS